MKAKTKPRYFYANVPIYFRLDSELSDPQVTLNGMMQYMEDNEGCVYADSLEVKCIQIKRRDVPKKGGL